MASQDFDATLVPVDIVAALGLTDGTLYEAAECQHDRDPANSPSCNCAIGGRSRNSG